jgi:hypothetical protein
MDLGRYNAHLSERHPKSVFVVVDIVYRTG